MSKRKTPSAAALDDASAVDGLTYREELFCHYYVETANGSEAYRRTGGKAKRADVAASQLMARDPVAKRISELRTRRLAAIEFNATEVLARLIAQVRADLSDIYDGRGALKPVWEWPDVWRTGLVAGIETVEEYDEDDDGNRVLTGYIKKVKISDRVKILELAGRHADIRAWKDKIEFDTSDVLKAMLESFARDTWVSAPTGAPPVNPGPQPGVTPPTPKAPGIAAVLDG